MADLKLTDMNLNLLVSLDALLSERNVTRAAKRLGVTQSAMSHSLRRLRDMFDDQLLVSGRGGMTLTPRAERLAAPLHEELRDLERVVRDEARFEPATEQRSFRIATTDFIGMLVIPTLLEILEDEAPGVDLVFCPHQHERISWLLETGEVSLALSVVPDELSTIRCKKLFNETFACLARKDHPDVRGELTLDQYLALPHALISPRSEGQGVVDRKLEELGESRRVALRVPSFAMAPMVIASTNLILTAPRRLVTMLANHLDLQVLEPPIALPSFSVMSTWHERFDQDPAHQWLREVVERATRGVRAG